MFQPESAPYIHQVSAGGYGLQHSLPEYTFEETPLRLAGSTGAGGYGGARLGTAGASGAESLIYSPLFSTTNAGVGPASSPVGAFDFHTTSATTHAITSTIPASSHHQHGTSPPHFIKMESNQDIIAQEAAARDYQPPQVEGPPIGEKTLSTAITAEYAKADPIYVQKTMALPETYSHYRPVLGDGNCGWRAIAFGYFETLAKGGNKELILSEKQRLEGLNSYIENVGGFQSYVFQDFADETFLLLQKLADLAADPENALTQLFDTFNGAEVANSVMYHFRLLASSYLKGNRERFGAFVPMDAVPAESAVDAYCSTHLERHGVEIEHLGLVLLVDVLLKPAGFALEVAYLDRSPGSEVNTYRFPEEANGQHPSTLGPMIHLLYRPDHYDLLYPTEPIPLPAPITLQVHRVGFSQNYDMAATPAAMHSFGAVDFNPLSLIPGYGAPPPGLGSVLDTSPSPLSTYSTSPVSPWVSSPFPDTPPQQVAPVHIPVSAPLNPAPPVAAPMHPTPPLQLHPLRFSEYCQMPEYVENDTWREPSFQTSSFKNSHFNVAHYNNPNFQPEEYKPGDDDVPPRSTKKRASV